MATQWLHSGLHYSTIPSMYSMSYTALFLRFIRILLYSYIYLYTVEYLPTLCINEIKLYLLIVNTLRCFNVKCLETIYLSYHVLIKILLKLIFYNFYFM